MDLQKAKTLINPLIYLNITQFLSALNDNAFRFLVVFFCLDAWGVEKGPSILSTTGMIFVIPFLLLSPIAGTLADRFSKRHVIVAAKTSEVFIVSIGVLAFWSQSPGAAYTTLFLMAAQSALFNPSKYGIIPELVPVDKVARANGFLSGLSFLAIVLGTALASLLTDITGRHFVASSLLCVVIAIGEVLSSRAIPKTPPSGSTQRFSPWFFLEVAKTVRVAGQTPRLLMAMLCSAYSLFIGGFVQLNLVPFAMESLHLSDVYGGYLCFVASVGIGAGSVVAGMLCGKKIELGLAPLGACGMAVSSLLLGIPHLELPFVLILIVFLGLFGGFFLVPLDASIQVSSPNRYRGQVVATTNVFSFLGLFAAALCLYLIEALLGFNASQGFLFLGMVTTIVAAVVTGYYRKDLYRT